MRKPKLYFERKTWISFLTLSHSTWEVIFNWRITTHSPKPKPCFKPQSGFQAAASRTLRQQRAFCPTPYTSGKPAVRRTCRPPKRTGFCFTSFKTSQNALNSRIYYNRELQYIIIKMILLASLIGKYQFMNAVSRIDFSGFRWYNDFQKSNKLSQEKSDNRNLWGENGNQRIQRVQ